MLELQTAETAVLTSEVLVVVLLRFYGYAYIVGIELYCLSS